MIQITTVVTTSAILCTNSQFRSPKWRKVNATLLITIGWSGGIPMTHAVQKWGRKQVDGQMGWDLLLIGAYCYVTGGLIYAVRIPERWRPGMFDLWGHSHQIMHLCAVVGAVVHLRALIGAFDYNHNPATRRCM